MGFYAEKMRIALTGRAGDWLARHSWPRLTMLVAFSLSASAAYQFSQYTVGWGGLAVRFSLSFLVAYAVFVLCLALWLSLKPSVDQAALLDGAPEAIETKNPWDDEAIENREQVIEHATRSAEQQAHTEGVGGLIVLALVAMIVGTVFVAAHMTWYARWYLGRLLVLGGKVRHRSLTEVPAASCLTAPVQLTLWTAVILLAHYAMLGLLLQWAFPQAVTVADIVRRMQP